MARHIHDLFWQLDALRQQVEQNGGLLLRADSKLIDRSLIEASRESMKQCREALRRANRLSLRFDD